MGLSAQESSNFETEEEKLERARERGDLYECGICFGEYIISEQMIACADGHLFCTECLRKYAKEAIYGQIKVSTNFYFEFYLNMVTFIFISDGSHLYERRLRISVSSW